MVALAASKFSARQLAAQIAAGAAGLAVAFSSLAPRSTEPDAAAELDRANAALTPPARAPTQTPPPPPPR